LDEVASAASKLAEFFAGKVIDLSEEDPVAADGAASLESAHPVDGQPTPPPNSSSSAIGQAEVEASDADLDDDDVPF
jgi:hypothetical protein